MTTALKEKLTIDSIVAAHLLYKDKDRLKGHRIGPSEISSACARQVVLGRSQQAVAVAEQPTLKGISVMLVGTALHEYFQDKVLKENGGIEIVEAEKFICSEHINGYIDGVIRFKGDERLALLELKTVNQVKFDKMRKSGHPLPEYVEQLTLYEGHEGIYEGYIFVINRGIFERDTAMSRALAPTDSGRDDEMFLTFKVTFNEKLYTELLNRAKELMKTVDEYREFGIIPDKPGMCTPNGFPCLWCRFKHFCWEGMYREVPAAELDAPTKDELMRLFKDHMANRAKAKALNDKLEASEKALNKFFRENGKKGFSAVMGENYVIGTDGSLYIEKIEDNRARKEYTEKRRSSELIVMPSAAEHQMTLEESALSGIKPDMSPVFPDCPDKVPETAEVREKQDISPETAPDKKKKRAPAKQKKESTVKPKKKQDKKTTRETSEEIQPEVPEAIPSEADYLSEVFASLGV